MVNDRNPLLDWHTWNGELLPPRHVAIVGQAPRQWLGYAADEVWVCNGPEFPPHWDVLWQLHGGEHVDRRHRRRDPLLLRRMKTAGTEGRRLFMPARWPAGSEGADAEAYPIELLAARLGVRYLTGSIPIMIAHAVELGTVERITLDGMRFTPHAQDWWAPGEGWMIPCTEYHLGRAAARGIVVEVNHGSGLFRGDGWVYGFEGPGAT